MEIIDVLKFIGLDSKESALYLALLELGTADVGDIAKKAGIKRPTCYLVLEELKNKSLVSEVPAKVHLFTAESPEKLASEMYKKQELYKRFLPNMLALYNTKKEKPQVQLFEGVEGVKEVYEKILRFGSVWFFGTAAEVEKLDPAWMNRFFKRIEGQNIEVRDIMAGRPADIKYAKSAFRVKNYSIKFLPQGMNFLSDSAIFGDSVVFFCFRPQIFSVLITSKDISNSLRTLYELAWRSAEILQA